MKNLIIICVSSLIITSCIVKAEKKTYDENMNEFQKELMQMSKKELVRMYMLSLEENYFLRNKLIEVGYGSGEDIDAEIRDELDYNEDSPDYAPSRVR